MTAIAPLPDPATWHTARRQWLILFAALAALVSVLAWQRGLGRLDHTIYDVAISLTGRAAPDDIVIVAIDAASLARIGRWPWRRALHATLVERIAADQPRGIALDLIFSEPEGGGAAASGASGDATLAAALAAAKAQTRVVLPLLREARPGAGLAPVKPIPQLAQHAQLGHIHLELDGDGIARSAFLMEGSATERLPHFALALAGSAAPAVPPGERHLPTVPGSGAWTRDHWIHIPFAGPPNTFHHVAYVDVLTGATPAGFFKDKYVLVGATAAGLGDSYPTPVSGGSRAMPGVEISANVLDGVLRDRSILLAPAWAQVAFALTPLVLLMLALLKLNPRKILQLWLALLAAVLVASLLLLAGLRWWFAPGAALAGLALAYPLWSWLRMEAALQFLAAEFGKLSSEPTLIGRPQQTVAPGTDLLEQRINEVRQGAAHLRDLRRFVSESLDSLPDATLVLDPQGTVLLANRRADSLYAPVPAPAVEGRPVNQLLHAWFDTPPTWTSLRETAQTEEGAELEARSGHKFLLRAGAYYSTATTRDSSLQNQSLPPGQDEPSPNGTPSGHILTLIDISPIRAAEQARDEALSFLSHDMRSPQSSILALLELHRLDPQGMPVPDMLDRIERYANRTLSLSEQFVQLGRAESATYHLADLDLSASLQDAIDEIWALASEKNISVHLDKQPGDDSAVIQADNTMLARVWQNLLSNAVKYSPADTTISVTVTEPPGKVRISIRDQGYGMSAIDVANLFSRFRRFEQPGQPKAEGAGLGLVFVKTVVERHRGTVLANSSPGQGTEFVLEFPASPPSPARAT